MRRSAFNFRSLRLTVHGSCFTLRTPNSTLRTSKGFAYIALLTTIVIIGISLGAAGRYWSNVIARDKEEELLFRGDQYRQAIERYHAAVPGQPKYPQNIDDLLKDSRTLSGKHHLRRKYKDPITGEDFIEIKNPANKQIIGVMSKSSKEPLKKDHFEEADKDLVGKSRYWEWIFIARAAPGQEPITISIPIPGGSPDDAQSGDADQMSGDTQFGNAGQTSVGSPFGNIGQTSRGAGGMITIVQPVDTSLPQATGQDAATRRRLPNKPLQPPK